MEERTTGKNLTTTSYAVLGLLSLRSWTTYELAEQMRRALGLFWPRAISGIYEEPKKLVAAGLARASADDVGRRRRTRYEITTRGRREVAAWVATPGNGPIVEFEQLVKVFFAEHGTKDDLLAILHGVRAHLRDRVAATVSVPHDYLDGRGEFPERLPWLILAGRFLDEFDQAVDRWTAWALETVEAWPDDISRAEPDLAALRRMARHSDRIAAEASDDAPTRGVSR